MHLCEGGGFEINFIPACIKLLDILKRKIPIQNKHILSVSFDMFDQ